MLGDFGSFKESELTEIENKIFKEASVIYRDLQDTFHRKQNENDSTALSFNLGFANGKGQLADDGSSHPNAPVKYVKHPEFHVRKNYKFVEKMEFFRNRKIYEIGVGPGYLFYLLENLLGCKMYGCDIDIETHEVYRMARTALGVQEKIKENRVTYKGNIGIEGDTEAVIAFWTVFNKKWNLEEHEWFLDECAKNLVGDKYVVLRFNNEGFLDNDEVFSFYERISERPIPNDPNFCVVKLS